MILPRVQFLYSIKNRNNISKIENLIIILEICYNDVPVLFIVSGVEVTLKTFWMWTYFRKRPVIYKISQMPKTLRTSGSISETLESTQSQKLLIVWDTDCKLQINVKNKEVKSLGRLFPSYILTSECGFEKIIVEVSE